MHEFNHWLLFLYIILWSPLHGDCVSHMYGRCEHTIVVQIAITADHVRFHGSPPPG